MQEANTVDPGARTQCSIRTAKIVSGSLRLGAPNCELLGVANYTVFRFADRFDKVSPKVKVRKSRNLSLQICAKRAMKTVHLSFFDRATEY